MWHCVRMAGEANERVREARRAVALMRCFEAGEALPADAATSVWHAFSDVLEELTREGLLARREGPFLIPTEQGFEAWRQLWSRLEGLRQLELLAAVNLRVELDERVSDDGAFVRSGVADPRFQPPASSEEAERAGTEDMRLAVIAYLSGISRERDEDPWRLALLLSLAEGGLTGEAAWFDLAHGQALKEIEERARAAYHARDVSDDPAEVDDVLRHIYEAAVVERRRRTGAPPHCLSSACAREAPPTSLWCPPCEERWLASLVAPLV